MNKVQFTQYTRYGRKIIHAWHAETYAYLVIRQGNGLYDVILPEREAFLDSETGEVIVPRRPAQTLKQNVSLREAKAFAVRWLTANE